MDPTGPGPVPSSVSLKSDSSKVLPVLFKGSPFDQSSDMDSLSLKSDSSKVLPVLFRGSLFDQSSDMDSLSLKSDSSKVLPILFRDTSLEDQRESGPKEHLDAIFMRLEEQILMFVKEQLREFHRLLLSEYPESPTKSGEEWGSREAVLNITLDFLRRMKQEQLADRLRMRSSVGVCRDELKRRLQQRFSCVFEGVAKAGHAAPLQQIYTELYITDGGASEVIQEHEVRYIEIASRKQAETAIACENMFKQRFPYRQQPIKEESTEEPIRTVLTMGVAGIGKTVLTQKFSLDWAEGKTNQDIQLLFPFTFRELSVLRGSEFSLVELLHHFFSQTKRIRSFEKLEVLFIFDGLDECRLFLDFSRTRDVTDPTESASVEELLVNLIRGSLLPSARLWITTRPAAANQIPAECVSMVTEVRGFTNPQKEQYFRKRFRDEEQATAVISHVKSIQSLYIMSNIPLFCWMLSTVLQKILQQTEKQELPKTLTEMYAHFLVVQAKVKNIKYHERSGTTLQWTPETRDMVRSLGKLAFKQLQKGNLIFYESDLNECGLDAEKIARYSGVFTQVFREERGLYQDKVYCFIHLSVQEFLAALHVHQTFFSSGENLLSTHQASERSDPEDFYHSAVDQALQSPNGHLDLFLRFLLGLSLPTNQNLLSGLLTHTENSSQINQETVTYIEKKLDEDVSAERNLNLLHCLNELNDHKLVEEIQSYLRKGCLSCVSPAMWSALSLLLLSSDSNLQQFDLRKYLASEKGFHGLLPVIKSSTKAILRDCGLSPLSCVPLASVLSSSSLTHLDLSNNDLQDSGVELLCEGLKSAPWRLHTLTLSGCMVSERGGAAVASALRSTPSHLRELDLSYNHPGSSTKLLTTLMAPHGPLNFFRLDPAGPQWMVPGLRKYSCKFSLDPNTAQRNLLLSEDKHTVMHVQEEQLCPDHEDRFTDHPQVLSSTGLSGRCYWEVEWSGTEVDIALSYRGIRHRENREERRFGNNDQSWTLRIHNKHYTVCNMKMEKPVHSCDSYDSGRVGVFLDSEAGALSFYEVQSSGEVLHIYTFICPFTEPLFPGFGVCFERDYVSVCQWPG